MRIDPVGLPRASDHSFYAPAAHLPDPEGGEATGELKTPTTKRTPRPSFAQALSTPGALGSLFGLKRTTTAEARDDVRVALKAFPAEVQHILAPFDYDRDGMLKADEIEAAAQALVESRRTVKKMMRMFLLFLVVLVVMCGTLGGIVFAVVNLTRQFDVTQGDVLAVRGTSNAVKVTSTALLQTASLASNMPDDVFDQLRYLQVTSPTGAVLNLQVTGSARIPTNLPPYGSVVHLYLGSLGYIVLEGAEIRFEEDLSTVFQKAGLATTDAGTGTARRRLLSSYNVVGRFNSLNKIHEPETYRTMAPKHGTAAAESTDTVLVLLKDTAAHPTCDFLTTHFKSVGRDRGPSRTLRLKTPRNDPNFSLDSLLNDIAQNCPEVQSAMTDVLLEDNGFVVREPTPLETAEAAKGFSGLDQETSGLGAPGRRLLQTVPDPNDPLYFDSGMWGQVYMDMQSAWYTTYGQASVPICIIDGGLRTAHVEFANQLWTNPGEIPNNGIDDDGNGFVDDVNGVRIISENNQRDNYIQDETGHGTHVSGIAGARINNAKGIAGYAPGTKIMTCKCANAHRGCSTADMASCIDYCSAEGAGIFSISQGSCTTNAYAISTMAAVFDRYPNATFFFSAGNNNLRLPESTGCGFPGNIDRPNVFAVGSVNWNYARSSFSNFGPSIVDFGAPGEYILSSSYSGTNSYAYMSGTSMAAPVAASVAALLRSINPNLTPTQIRTAFLASCDLISGGTSIFKCGGMINARRAVAYVKANYGTA